MRKAEKHSSLYNVLGQEACLDEDADFSGACRCPNEIKGTTCFIFFSPPPLVRKAMDRRTSMASPAELMFQVCTKKMPHKQIAAVLRSLVTRILQLQNLALQIPQRLHSASFQKPEGFLHLWVATLILRTLSGASSHIT